MRKKLGASGGTALDPESVKTFAWGRHCCGANIALRSDGLRVAPILILQLLSQFAFPQVASCKAVTSLSAPILASGSRKSIRRDECALARPLQSCLAQQR
ncbi:hypothetical protein [Bradyrhizobium liaoningense]|uniref:hypothetical protein n=1 Tax=Bradyrhizobium liaoningense TaxID=43992 RepID=UPI001BA916F8|nr:hypothetical protein [Bradyrhizobium liaoningense]MBR0985785.1 hypothetical protein [Bradyrhizobium liaoningense]